MLDVKKTGKGGKDCGNPTKVVPDTTTAVDRGTLGCWGLRLRFHVYNSLNAELSITGTVGAMGAASVISG